MTSLKDLVKASQEDKPVTIRHERWLMDNPDPVYSPEALQFAADELSDTSNNEPAQRSQRMFRVSGMHSCSRQRILLRYGMVVEKRPDSRTSNIFHTGKFIHLKWQMAGLTEGWLAQAEVSMVDEELQLRGHTDGVLYDGSLLEIKSINDRGFDHVYRNGIKDDHKGQATGYLYMTDKPAISFIYENKNTQEWWEYRYQRNRVDEDAMLDEMRTLVRSWDNRELPPVLSSCERKEGFAYTYCPFKKQCLEMHAKGVKTLEH